MTEEEIERLTRIVDIIYEKEWPRYFKTLAEAIEGIIYSSHFGQILAESHI